MAACSDDDDDNGNGSKITFLNELREEGNIGITVHHFINKAIEFIPLGLSEMLAVMLTRVSKTHYELSVLEDPNSNIPTAYDDFGKKTHQDPWKVYPEPFLEFVCGSVFQSSICIFERYRYVRIAIEDGNWVMKDQPLVIKPESGNSYKPAIACSHNNHIIAGITDKRTLFYKYHAKDTEFRFIHFGDDMEDNIPTSVRVSEHTEGEWLYCIIVGFSQGILRIYDVAGGKVSLEKQYRNRGIPCSLTVFKDSLFCTQNTKNIIFFHKGRCIINQPLYLDVVPFWTEIIEGYAAIVHDRSNGIHIIFSDPKLPPFTISNYIILQWITKLFPIPPTYFYSSIRVFSSCLCILLSNGCLVKLKLK